MVMCQCMGVWKVTGQCVGIRNVVWKVTGQCVGGKDWGVEGDG